jgi:hypothetical protein
VNDVGRSDTLPGACPSLLLGLRRAEGGDAVARGAS